MNASYDACADGDAGVVNDKEIEEWTWALPESAR